MLKSYEYQIADYREDDNGIYRPPAGWRMVQVLNGGGPMAVLLERER